MRDFFSIVDLSQSHPEIPDPCHPALFIYPGLFLSGLEPSASCLAWKEGKDGCMRTPLRFYMYQQVTCVYSSLCSPSA